MYDLFYDNIVIDLANYADGTIPYAYDFENEKVTWKKILISFLIGTQVTF